MRNVSVSNCKVFLPVDMYLCTLCIGMYISLILKYYKLSNIYIIHTTINFLGGIDGTTLFLMNMANEYLYFSLFKKNCKVNLNKLKKALHHTKANKN